MRKRLIDPGIPISDFLKGFTFVEMRVYRNDVVIVLQDPNTLREYELVIDAVVIPDGLPIVGVRLYEA